MRTEEQQREYDSDMEQAAMSQGEYMSAAVRQWAGVYGEDRPDDRWVLSPFDTWENNPHWNGTDPYQPHPEDGDAIEAYYFVGPPQPEEEEEVGLSTWVPDGWTDDDDEDLPF
jgi:hypothetical protein